MPISHIRKIRQPVRSAQVKRIPQNRRLLAHWVAPTFTPTALPSPKPTISGQKQLGRLLVSRAKQGVQLFNAPIVRVGPVRRQQRNSPRNATGIAPLQIPVSETDFNSWYSGRRSAEKRGVLRQKEHLRKNSRVNARLKSAAYERYNQKAHNAFAFNIGINSIVEVGNDGRNNPTHIIVMKRGRAVPEAPEFWDFPAGLVRAGQKPAQVITSRVTSELGLDAKKLSTIGPGLKPVSEDVWLTLHRIDKANNYNAVVVQRADISAINAAQKIRQNISAGKKAANPWTATDFKLIPRNPAAIREFLRTHDKTWMPEVLRLYARELSKQAK